VTARGSRCHGWEPSRRQGTLGAAGVRFRLGRHRAQQVVRFRADVDVPSCSSAGPGLAVSP
jgi:hypothetical protein